MTSAECCLLTSLLVHMQIVLALSNEQIQDLMLVRLLYHSKRTWLRQQRRQLMSQMSDVEDQSSHPCQHLCVMTDLSKHLKDNSAQNHQLYYRIARVVYRGVGGSDTRCIACVCHHCGCRHCTHPAAVATDSSSALHD